MASGTGRRRPNDKTVLDTIPMLAAVLLVGSLTATAGAQGSVGVCYGMLGNDLPQATDVVTLYKQHNIGLMRIYWPDRNALQALRRSNIGLILDVPSEHLQELANPDGADAWVRDNILAYGYDVKFRYIAVGNELIPNSDKARFILPAMRNVYAALSRSGLQDVIKVSTAVHTFVLGASYPPSAGEFTDEARRFMRPIAQFLAQTGAPLLANVYPYFSHIQYSHVSLSYALFTEPGPVVQDGPYSYQNIFDAILDAMYAALEKVGAPGVGIVVSETGWPSSGRDAATRQNAQTYNQNLIRHVKRSRGTPRRPGRGIEAYLFAMFNENQKRGEETERHFGLFYPSKAPVYPINFF